MLGSLCRSTRAVKSAAAWGRAFSAEAHAPPVALFGIPARYANATFTAASKVNKLDAVEVDLHSFGEVLRRNPEMAAHLGNPTLQRSDKMAIVEKIFDGKKTTDISRNLFMTMAANARLGDAGKVIDAFSTLVKEKRGVVDVTIEARDALTAQQDKALKKALAKHVGEDKKLNITFKSSPAVVAGMMVYIGDRTLDLSAKTSGSTLLQHASTVEIESVADSHVQSVYSA